MQRNVEELAGKVSVVLNSKTRRKWSVLSEMGSQLIYHVRVGRYRAYDSSPNWRVRCKDVIKENFDLTCIIKQWNTVTTRT